MLARTIAAFAEHPSVDDIRRGDPSRRRPTLYERRASPSRDACGRPVPGGARRQDSVRAGLEALAATRPPRVLIHDAARPFVDAGR